MALPIGISVGGSPDVVAAASAAAERRGMQSIWLAETARTVYIAAAVTIQATTTATIGTSIALAFPRSPVITAMTARDLAELSNGRFVLGLGTQVKRVNEQRYATPFEHPAPKIREVIDVKYFTEVVRPAIDEGLAKSGRDRAACKVSQGSITSVADTTEDAIRGAKLQIGFYGTTRTYAKLFEIHGWGHMTAALREAFARGDFEAMIDCVSDEMAETYSIFGTPDEANDKAKRWAGLADELIVSPPWAAPETQKNDEVFTRLIETFV